MLDEIQNNFEFYYFDVSRLQLDLNWTDKTRRNGKK